MNNHYTTKYCMADFLKPVLLLSVILGLAACATTQQTTQEPIDAQASLSDSALFYYGEDSVLADDFLFVYLKNHQDSIADLSADALDASIRDYLDLYVNFKLKVKAAYESGMHREAAFLKEFSQYKEQLAKPYMAENRFKENMVLEAYERMSQEIHASHILISVPEASEDTLQYYLKADSLRQLAEGGASFAMLAEEHSEDPSAPQNGGNLGYFTALQMVYPFENVAYETMPGKISRPVRTRFGYHIIKVHDKRPARGSVKVAHIMIRHNEGEDQDESSTAYAEIKKIYDELQSGEDWNELAERYSEDVSTRANGGELPYFGTGGMLKEFEEAAFKLEEEGAISEPVSTRYGWHILKLIDRKGLESLESLRPGIERKVQRILQVTEMQQDMIDMLKTENGYQPDRDNLEILWLHLQDAPEVANLSDDLALFEIGQKQFTVRDFMQYLQQKNIEKPLDSATAEEVYREFEKERILLSEEENLAEKYPEFRRLLLEYKEGILLFNIMERQVWAKANTDNEGLRAFFRTHEDQYRWQERVDATIFESKDPEVLRQIKSELGIQKPGQERIEDYEEKFNRADALNLKVYQDFYEKGGARRKGEVVLDQIAWESGIYELTEEPFSYLVIVHEKMEAAPKNFDDIKGLVIADYQRQLDQEWVQELRERYPIEIDERVLKQLIQKIEHESI